MRDKIENLFRMLIGIRYSGRHMGGRLPAIRRAREFTMGRVSGKVVIITGAASGMGLSAAKLFVEEGAKVVAGVNRTPIPQEAFDVAAASEGELVDCKLTISEEDDWIRAVAFTLETFGKIDVLINNAGATCTASNILDETPEEWTHDLQLNLMGPALGIKHVVPAMRENGGGSIINTSSSSGYSPDMGVPASYCAAKRGLEALTKHAAIEFAPDNIRVNTIIPGAFYTGMIEKLGITHEQMSAMYTEKAPLAPHAADPIEIANAYLYLASDESKFVTGAELAVDGGMIVG